MQRYGADFKCFAHWMQRSTNPMCSFEEAIVQSAPPIPDDMPLTLLTILNGLVCDSYMHRIYGFLSKYSGIISTFCPLDESVVQDGMHGSLFWVGYDVDSAPSHLIGVLPGFNGECVAHMLCIGGSRYTRCTIQSIQLGSPYHPWHIVELMCRSVIVTSTKEHSNMPPWEHFDQLINVECSGVRAYMDDAIAKDDGRVVCLIIESLQMSSLCDVEHTVGGVFSIEEDLGMYFLSLFKKLPPFFFLELDAYTEVCIARCNREKRNSWFHLKRCNSMCKHFGGMRKPKEMWNVPIKRSGAYSFKYGGVPAPMPQRRTTPVFRQDKHIFIARVKCEEKSYARMVERFQVFHRHAGGNSALSFLSMIALGTSIAPSTHRRMEKMDIVVVQDGVTQDGLFDIVWYCFSRIRSMESKHTNVMIVVHETNTMRSMISRVALQLKDPHDITHVVPMDSVRVNFADEHTSIRSTKVWKRPHIALVWREYVERTRQGYHNGSVVVPFFLRMRKPPKSHEEYARLPYPAFGRFGSLGFPIENQK